MLIRIRPFLEDDIPFGMALKEQAGWNQVPADWQRRLDLQLEGCFVAENNGGPVGTVATCVFGPVAWIGMMLVDLTHRRQGIGRALMVHALEYLEAQDVASVRLDATPLGQPLYESLGFTCDATVLRYEGVPRFRANHVSLFQGTDRDLTQACTLDRIATGTDRQKLIERLASEFADTFRVCRPREGTLEGFSLARPGSRSVQIGPCIAGADAGPLLLDEALDRYAGRNVIVDVPERHREARARVEAAGLPVARTLTRMTRGPRVPERLEQIWASSGPEMG